MLNPTIARAGATLPRPQARASLTPPRCPPCAGRTAQRAQDASLPERP